MLTRSNIYFSGEGGLRNRGLGTPSGRSIAASGFLSLCSFVAELICLPHGQKRQLLLKEKMTYEIRIKPICIVSQF